MSLYLCLAKKTKFAIKMNSKVYKWCAVPLCKNTSIATPNKVFVHVPNKKIIRDKWLKLARRNPNDVVTNSPLYFCEDHFDLPNDMENYMQYHVMGSVSQVRMKPGCVPKKFICQPDRAKRTSDTTERPYIVKKRRMMTLQECEKQLEEKIIVTEQSSSEDIASLSSDIQHEGVICSCCNSEILGNRYTCLQCLSVDLCTSCEAANFHPDHVVLRLPTPTLYDTVLPCLESVKKALGITLSNSPGTSSSRKSTQKTTSKEDKEFIEKDLSDSQDSNAPLTPALIKPSKQCSSRKSTGLKRVRNENSEGSKKRKGDNEVNTETSGDNDQNISIKTEDRDTQPDGTAEQQSIEMVYLDSFMTNNQEVDETRDVITEDDIKVEIKTEDEFSAEEEKFTY